MNRRYRLKSSMDFKRVRRTGKSYAHPLVILIASPNDRNISRYGVTAGRSLGGAVARNRAVRRLRAAIHSSLPNLKPGWDIILIARAPIIDADWRKVCSAIKDLHLRAGLLVNKEK